MLGIFAARDSLELHADQAKDEVNCDNNGEQKAEQIEPAED